MLISLRVLMRFEASELQISLKRSSGHTLGRRRRRRRRRRHRRKTDKTVRKREEARKVSSPPQ
jgi:hypothetical protein